MDTVYVGTTTDGMDGQVIVNRGGKIEPLNPRFDLRNHSPDGFAWGYSGSGPSQLALAILADHTGCDELAEMLYHRFKDTFIATLARTSNFALVGSDIEAWLPDEKKKLRHGWRRGFAKAEFEPFLSGKTLVPNYQPMDPGALISAVACGGLLLATEVKHAQVEMERLGQYAPWARYFLNHTQGGTLDGTGLALIYGSENGHGGRFSICAHEKIGTGSRDDERRGWHPGFCWKCGLDMTVDSGD